MNYTLLIHIIFWCSALDCFFFSYFFFHSSLGCPFSSDLPQQSIQLFPGWFPVALGCLYHLHHNGRSSLFLLLLPYPPTPLPQQLSPAGSLSFYHHQHQYCHLSFLYHYYQYASLSRPQQWLTLSDSSLHK